MAVQLEASLGGVPGECTGWFYAAIMVVSSPAVAERSAASEGVG